MKNFMVSRMIFSYLGTKNAPEGAFNIERLLAGYRHTYSHMQTVEHTTPD